MEYGKIIAITGLPGLYELLSTKNDGGIVRSLEDKTTKFVTSRKHNFSHLESIEVYTVKENVNLIELFIAMKNAGKEVPDGKDVAKLKKYFEEVYPDLDFERVYNSDLKKMAKWYQILTANNVEFKLSAVEEETAEEVPVAEVEETEEKPKKKTAKKSAKTEEAAEGASPAKKTAKKKAAAEESETTEEDAEKPVKKPTRKKSS